MITKGSNIIKNKSSTAEFLLKSMSVCFIYNTTTRSLRGHVVNRKIHHTNINPSCVSNAIIKIVNPDTNEDEYFHNMLMKISEQNITSI